MSSQELAELIDELDEKLESLEFHNQETAHVREVLAARVEDYHRAVDAELAAY